MAVEDVQSYTITKKDYNSLSSLFTSEYLTIQPDYKLILAQLDEVELFLTEEEIKDLEEKLDILSLTD